MTERPDSEGGVFISTPQIYDLLREHMAKTDERITQSMARTDERMNQLNEHLVEIRADIRAMNKENSEVREGHRDHESRLRKVEEKLNKLPATVITSAVSAVISAVLLYLKFTGK